MKKVLFVIAVVGGAVAVLRLLPDEQRKNLSQLPGAMMGRMMEHMPED